jgi:hypothetical protein
MQIGNLVNVSNSLAHLAQTQFGSARPAACPRG